MLAYAKLLGRFPTCRWTQSFRVLLRSLLEHSETTAITSAAACMLRLIPNLLFWPRIVMGSFGRYQCLKVNVDMLRVIQIGITFSDDDGNFPTDTPCTWQFHFSFSLQSDMYAPPPPKCQSSPLRPHSARAATPRTPFSCCALQVTPPCTRFRPRILTLRHLFSPRASTLHIKPGFSTKSLISPQASTLPDTAAWASTCRISGSCS